ncbi:hypothetical protein BVRB_8g193730 [Beta vulgaris subsp. vulgaris]|uniref:uncharacterized protein LOC104901979 n=1 Tax=Beta vulgaris subsp. vulgaris TaxID=3555 RepID=UPI00053FAAE7|nr:uncharacterized protein LOC104901979 [Beta vulgaris subsp. vulgaris]KMT02788.1 hypothetical protein BVRB_8g193730 [Beta vulgaris subsp. vulgaris]
MDSRDSTSSSPMNVVREGADDDGALSVTAMLAKEAFMFFQSDKFSECVDVLHQLLQKKEGDPKILHNISVSEFLRDGCSDPKKLVEVLVTVKRKSEDLARASREQSDVAAQAANKVITGAKGTNNLANSPSTVFTDEFDASVAALNIATVLFHLHEYSKALSVLEPLFQNIEPIDETTALHVCLLLLDVALVTQEASKFSDVISYLEKAFGVSYMLNQADGGSTGQHQTSNLVLKSTSIPNNSSASDEFNPEGTVSGITSEGSLSRTLSDETIEYENLLSTLDISGQNISRASNLSTSSDLLRADRSTPTINLRLQLPLYKIQLLLLTRNLKAAKREVKLAMNIARGIDSSRALLLKSQLEYARGNYPKAFKLLRASNSQSDVGSSIIINNNTGCIYYQQGNYHISSIFFHKALSNCSSLWKEKPRKLVTFSQDKSLLVAYNCGVQYLACGKPVLAARCFLKASFVFYNKPLLWLRLAECCLMALEKGPLKHSEESQLKAQVIGQGKWRHLAFENGSLRNGIVSSDDKEDLGLDNNNSKPKLSMTFARQCLLNALHLLGNSEFKHTKSLSLTRSSSEENDTTDVPSKNPGHKNLGSNDVKSKDTAGSGQVSANGDAREQRGGAHSNTAAANALSEYEEICRRENQKIKQAVLIDLAFVELELGNPLKALTTALTLLKIPECSRMYAFWGHIYAAEALCLLNRLKEAAEHLSTYLSGGTLELPYSEEDCRLWQAKKTLDADDPNTGQTATRVPSSVEQQDNVFLTPEEARGALYVNLASMLVLQGEFEQASRYATQALASLPNSQEAALMAVYLDLKLAKPREALAKLKRCCRVKFLPFTSRSKADS